MSTPFLTGSRTHRYKINDGWGQLPEDISFGYTHGVCVDQRDNVYVFNTSKDAVIIFDRDGNYLRSWGTEFAGGAHGFYLHRDEDGIEYLYMTDIQRGLMVKATLNGDVILRIGAPDRPDLYDPEHRYIPTDVCVAPNGDIYVADGYGQYYIHQYNRMGIYLRTFGGRGSELGKLLEPHGISLNLRHGDAELYVADRRNHRVQTFTLDGQPKYIVDHDLDLPCGFYFYGEEVYIADLDSRVTILDGDNRLITHLGEDQQAYKQEGWPDLPKSYYLPDKFSSPHGICVDSHGDVYVVEWISDGRLTKLIRQR